MIQCNVYVDIGSTSSSGTASGNNPVLASGASLPLSVKIGAKDLRVIKWTDERGQIQRYFLMEKIQNKWSDIGELVGLSLAQLEDISKEHQRNAEQCFRAVLKQWFDHPPPDYPTTWSGLLELLEDCRLTDVVAELKDALRKA